MLKKNKYLAKKNVIFGEVFDSKKEANRYMELKTKEQAGEIIGLQRQVPFVLIPNQYEESFALSPKKQKQKIVKKLVERKVEYKADFVYNDKDGNQVVEDAKGYRGSTAYAVFVIKRKLMYQVYGIKVKEV